MSAGEPAIRPATPVDRHALVELWLALVDHHRALDPDYRVADGLREAIVGELARGLASERCALRVAEREGRPIGFVFCEIGSQTGLDDPDVGWIHELYVDAKARGRGLGRALVESGLSFFRARGVTRLAVRVERGNPDALRFWRDRGYVPRAQLLEREL